MRLLQTSDANNDPSNGIEIPTVVSAALDDADLGLDQDAETFESSAAIRSLLTALSRAELVTAEAAEAHFQVVFKSVNASPGFEDGAIWQAFSTDSECPYLTGIKIMQFGNGLVSVTGGEIERNPTGKYSEGGYELYACNLEPIDIQANAAEWASDFCAQESCNSIAALNGSREDRDSDGRLYLTWTSGAPLVKRTVKYRNDEGHFNGFSISVTLIRVTDLGGAPKVDLTGTWNVRGYESLCPTIESKSEYTFTKTGISGIFGRHQHST